MLATRVSQALILVGLIIALSLPACAPQAVPTPAAPAATSAPTDVPTTEPPASPLPTLAPVASATLEATPVPSPIAAPSTDIEGTFKANGRSLYIVCIGTGSPTIVLEGGEGEGVADLRAFQGALAEQTTTCAYDRANNGRSDRAETPRTAQDVADDLQALLAAAGVPGPYVLVGSSAGGMMVQYFARAFPNQAAGVLAMNPVPPADPWLDEAEALFTPEEYAGEVAYYQGQNGENFDYLTSSEQIAAAPAPPEVPFEMIISTNVQCEGADICLKSYAVYEDIMQAVTADWPQGNFSRVMALHQIFSSNSEAAVAAVMRILYAVITVGR